MGVQNGPRYEALSATGTYVRPFTRVIAFVHHQGGPLGEGFAALVARILSFSSVSDVVSPEQGLAGETLAADLAGVRFLASVRTVVNLQPLRCLQLLAAKGAQVSAPLVVGGVAVGLHFVLLQHGLVLVNLATNVALVLRRLLVPFLELLLHQCRGVVVVQSIVLLQTASHCLRFRERILHRGGVVKEALVYVPGRLS